VDSDIVATMLSLRRDRRRQAEPVASNGPTTAAGSDSPTVAVMTVTRDEADMLPRWIAHYGTQVGVDNLLVFDDNSSDGSTDDLPCTVHHLPKLPGNGGFNQARMRLLSGVADGLLACYDAVVFTDTDEFIIADPAKYENLVEFIAAHPDWPVIAPVGLNVLHYQQVEGPLDLERPILGQRQFAKFVPIMCKPSVKRVPAAWRHGSHAVHSPFRIHPDLFMVHLKFHDRETLRHVAELRRQMVETDGRSVKTSWAKTGDEMAEMLDDFVGEASATEAREFDASKVNLEIVRKSPNGNFRAFGPGQVQSMKKQPLVRVPERLFGLV
jgi:hypothetical protein